jgi:hypothetical protein
VQHERVLGTFESGARIVCTGNRSLKTLDLSGNNIVGRGSPAEGAADVEGLEVLLEKVGRAQSQHSTSMQEYIWKCLEVAAGESGY